MNNIILLNELQREEDYDTAFFLTYTINLSFFESMILPRLRRMGVSRIGILIDYRGYQESLEHAIPSGCCGREYILAPIHLPKGGIQHAKLLWLQKHERITAYIGSHNLTMAGYNDQTEVTAKLMSTDQSHVQALQQIYNDISQIEFPSCLSYVWQHIKPPTNIHSPSNITMISSLHRSLLDQLIEKVQSADALRVVTPFLDAQALSLLAKKVQAKEVVLDLPQEGPDTPLSVTMNAIPNVHPRFLYGKRRLHAKAYQFKNAHMSSVALGSANCTQAALMRSVADGGNLEFLLFIEEDVTASHNYLDDDALDFKPIIDAETFPYTGRDWTISSLEYLSILRLDEVTYNDGVLTVKWSQQDDLDVEDATLTTDTGESIYSGKQHQITIALQEAPQKVTLEAIANEDFCKTHAWVINYTALNARVIENKQSTWIERLATNDFQQLPKSIAIWLEQAVQDYLALKPDSDSAQVNKDNTKKQRAKIKQWYEVFSYSSNLDLVRNTARSILETEASIYNFYLLRMLLSRPNGLSSINSNTENEVKNQYYEQQRNKAFKNILRVVDRYLFSLLKASRDPAFKAENDFVARLKIGLGTVACVCVEVKDSSIKERETLLNHFIEFLIQLNMLSIASDLVRTISIQGPLLLCIGAIALFAEKRGEHYLQLKEQAQNMVGNDPRAILAEWERNCDMQGLQDIRAQVEKHVFNIFEIASGHLTAQVDKRWSCLLKLQKADIESRAEREELYKQAKEKYEKEASTYAIWNKYVAERRRGNFSVIFSCKGKLCPKCRIHLSKQKIQMLQRAEAVICDNCQKILIAG